MKHILLYTRPINPPWDEASKNLAYDIARHISGDVCVHALTTRGSFAIQNLHNTPLVMERIFYQSKLDFNAKWSLIRRLFQSPLDADIVHFLFTPRPLTSFFLKMGLSRTNVKTIQTIATIEDSTLKNPTALRNILFANKIIAQSHYTTKRLQAAGFSNVQCIYPGIDLQKYNPRLSDATLRSSLGIDPTARVILFAGEYTRLQAMDDIIDAIDTVYRSNPPGSSHLPITFILACRIKSTQDQEKKRIIIERIRQMGYTNQVVLLDTVTDMPALYALSDINIFPVRSMAGKFDIPLAIVEAMAMGKPVISSDLPMLTECVLHENNGLVIPPADPSALTQAIIRLVEDQELTSRLGLAANQFVQRHFDIARNILAYQSIYQSL